VSQPIPEWARDMHETLKIKDEAMKNHVKSHWEQELFKYIWVTNGQLLCNPEKLEDVIERIRNEGRESVLYIRCMKHRGGPQYNKDEHGQECTECAVQSVAAPEREKP
jgi:hypothetical protein